MAANLTTFVARVADSMLLVASMDSGTEGSEYKDAAKKILKTLKPGSPSKCSINAGQFLYHYIIESGVVYLCLAEKGYPKRLAFQYLEEVHREFSALYGVQVAQFSRPYACVSFDPRMSKIRRDFLDPHSPANIAKLNSDLADIHSIMSSNINEVLQRGEKLDVMESRSSALLSESKKFEKLGRYINLQALYKTYGPIVAVVVVVAFILYLRFRTPSRIERNVTAPAQRPQEV